MNHARQGSGKVPLDSGRVLVLVLLVAGSLGSAMPCAAQSVVPVTITGTVASLPAGGGVGLWQVGPYEVRVTAETRLRLDNGPIRLGSEVEVQGALRARHSIEARVITALRKGPPPATLVGLVEELPEGSLVGLWKVAGISVQVAETTAIDETAGAVEIGARVKVVGTSLPDGAGLAAQEIRVLAGQPKTTACTFAVVHLVPVGPVQTAAEGVVVARTFSSADGTTRADLKVGVEGLLPRTDYAVVFDGFAAGTITTNDEGEGHLFLSTADIPGADPLPAELLPLTGLQVGEIAAPDGSVVLRGAFADARVQECGRPVIDYLAVAVLRTGEGKVVGAAAAWIRDGVQQFDVLAGDLPPAGEIRVDVDGTTVGTVTASDSGRVRVAWSSDPQGNELPLPEALNPVSGLMHVTIADANGIIAEGDLEPVAAATWTAPGQVRRRLSH